MGILLQDSSEHAEYVPWFIKKGEADLIEKYKIPINEYIDRCENYEKLWGILNQDISQITNGPFDRSNEYASSIMDGISK